MIGEQSARVSVGAFCLSVNRQSPRAPASGALTVPSGSVLAPPPFPTRPGSRHATPFPRLALLLFSGRDLELVTAKV